MARETANGEKKSSKTKLLIAHAGGEERVNPPNNFLTTEKDKVGLAKQIIRTINLS